MQKIIPTEEGVIISNSRTCFLNNYKKKINKRCGEKKNQINNNNNNNNNKNKKYRKGMFSKHCDELRS